MQTKNLLRGFEIGIQQISLSEAAFLIIEQCVSGIVSFFQILNQAIFFVK